MTKAAASKEKDITNLRSMGESKSKNHKHKRYTLRGISSLLNLDTFNTKRKKLLHQSLQGTSRIRILKSRTRRIEYKQ
jgi:hypothetical protein